MTKGTYLLLLELEKPQSIAVGALGGLRFSQGFYAYVGSAMNGLEARVARHFRHNKKRRWHVDYLSGRARIYDVVFILGEQRLECTVAASLSRTLLSIHHFGSSDCGCPSHLFLASAKAELETAVERVLSGLTVQWFGLSALMDSGAQPSHVRSTGAFPTYGDTINASSYEEFV